MECSDKHGGRMLFHWTHQNGMSVDFMTPKQRGDEQDPWLNDIGLFHYLLKFDSDGRSSLSKKTYIDFESMAKHLIALDEAAVKNGLRIRKILFHTDLHDELFKTSSGPALASRDLPFIPRLNRLINRFHDDHYHVDFEFLEGG
jgi:penicillin-insensitive murein endopeptidase